MSPSGQKLPVDIGQNQEDFLRPVSTARSGLKNLVLLKLREAKAVVLARALFINLLV